MEHALNIVEDIDLLILDLDGTVRYCTVPGQPCPNKPGEQVVHEGTLELLWAYEADNTLVKFASNQGGVRRGFLTQPDLAEVCTELVDLLEGDFHEGDFLFATAGKGCVYTKPHPGMLVQHILEAGNPRLDRVLYVGDYKTDKEAAERCGCRFMWAWDWNPNIPIPEWFKNA